MPAEISSIAADAKGPDGPIKGALLFKKRMKAIGWWNWMEQSKEQTTEKMFSLVCAVLLTLASGLKNPPEIHPAQQSEPLEG